MAESIQTKRCLICKQTKQLSEFHKNPTYKDGHCSKCKICDYKISRTYILTEKGKQVSRKSKKKYKQSEKGKATQKRYQQTEKNRAARKRFKQSAKGKASYKRYYSRHPEQCKARIAVRQAIAVGKLPRVDILQCHYCPEQAKEWHHYKGYAPEHWLDVIPACIECHSIKTRRAS